MDSKAYVYHARITAIQGLGAGAMMLVLAAFTKLKTPKTHEYIGASSTWMALLLTMGTGIFLVGLCMLPSVMGFSLVSIGLVLMIFLLRKLLSKGSLTFRRGMPAILATRGLFFAAYTSIQLNR